MVVPPAKFCTDQGSMSTCAAIENLSVRSNDGKTLCPWGNSQK